MSDDSSSSSDEDEEDEFGDDNDDNQKMRRMDLADENGGINDNRSEISESIGSVDG
jgi:hypothetical protein